MPVKITLLLSGGLDSTVLAWHLGSQGHRVYPLGINYGQLHACELLAASQICEHGGLRFSELAITRVQPPSANEMIPDGHYNDERMKAMVSPNRNMILLAYATAWAMTRGHDAVAYAAHGGDHTIYPDCRPEFVEALREAIRVGNWDAPALLAPFVHWSKTGIVTEGARLGAPMHLTWSCYRGGAKHCGTCGTCYERKEAFTLAGVPDPTEYA